MKAQTGGDQTRENPPAGLTVGRCIKVIDLGTQETMFGGKHQIFVYFELPKHRIEIDGEDLPMAISKKYTLSFNKKARLRQDLEQWYGKKFDDKQIDASGGFDPSKILGRPAQIMITHDENNGKVYANINGLMPLPDGAEAPAQENPSELFDLDDPDWDVFDSFGRGMQDWIAKSPEFQALPQRQPAAPVESGEKEDYDDIPF